MYYISSFACFKISFKGSKIVNFKISRLWDTIFSQNLFRFRKLCEVNFIGDFNSLAGENDATALFYQYIITSYWTVSFCF